MRPQALRDHAAVEDGSVDARQRARGRVRRRLVRYPEGRLQLRMFRNPVVVGGGTPFLPPVTDDIALDLIETRTFGSRVIYERYWRARDESE